MLSDETERETTLNYAQLFKYNLETYSFVKLQSTQFKLFVCIFNMSTKLSN